MTVLKAEVAQLKEAVSGLAAQETRVDRPESDIARVGSETAELRTAVEALKRWTGLKVDSLIIGGLPPLLEEFNAKRFTLLWRGSRDGFTVRQFHRRCDGRINTLTLIADTDGNVLDGFTPVKWENGGGYKGDHSGRSFLYTPRNPHDLPPRKFALKAEKKQWAIDCDSACCAVFGCSCICVFNNCNRNTNSHTKYFGDEYDSVSGGREGDFLTGAENFTVKEIEVFEIAD
jgi:hypothetical protein